MKPMDIVLIHTNGEKRTVPVEYIPPHGRYVTIRWGLAGNYDIDLIRNSMKAGRGKTLSWRIEDVGAVRAQVTEHNRGKQDNPTEYRLAAIRRHVESMPTKERVGKR